ncbi:MAG: hypothetical protein HY874_04225 [Chloroflexi bacterium]|nr:hypothetical protein [Chloroflexota bacterium]
MRPMSLAVLGLALGAVMLLGCGGSGTEPSLKVYYAEMVRVQVEGQQRTPSANVNLGEIPADTPPEELRGRLKEGLRASRVLNDAYLQDVKSIEPPAEAETAHGELVAAIDAVNAWLDGMIAGVDGISSLDEFDALVNRSAFLEAEQAFAEACAGLQRIATDDGIEVDLQCTH